MRQIAKTRLDQIGREIEQAEHYPQELEMLCPNCRARVKWRNDGQEGGQQKFTSKCEHGLIAMIRPIAKGEA